MPHYIGFLFFYGVLYGLGGGWLYMTSIFISSKYFPQKKGMCSGIINAGFGFGSFIPSIITLNMCNPESKKPTKIGNEFYFEADIADNVPATLRVLGIFYFCLIVIGSLL